MLPCDVAPLTPLCTTVHMYNVPPTAFGLVNTKLVDVAVQMVCWVGLTVKVGAGFTVTSTVVVAPAHPLTLGVIV